MFARHEANLPSGGQVTDEDVEEFLWLGPVQNISCHIRAAGSAAGTSVAKATVTVHAILDAAIVSPHRLRHRRSTVLHPQSHSGARERGSIGTAPPPVGWYLNRRKICQYA